MTILEKAFEEYGEAFDGDDLDFSLDGGSVLREHLRRVENLRSKYPDWASEDAIEDGDHPYYTEMYQSEDEALKKLAALIIEGLSAYEKYNDAVSNSVANALKYKIQEMLQDPTWFKAVEAEVQ